MMLTAITYVTVVAVWLVLFALEYVRPRWLPQARRSLTVLFFSSLVVLIAWVLETILLSLAGSILALIALSLHGPTMHNWFKQRFNFWALLLWLLWFTTVSLTMAHVVYLYRTL